MSQEANERQLPYIAGVNQEFLGLGHVLQSKKKERRQAREQLRLLQNKVSYLEKQDRNTSRSIQQQRKMLERVMSVRQRRQNDRREKQLQNHLAKQQQMRLKLQSQFQRRQHERRLEQAMDRLSSQNKYIFTSIKGKIQDDLIENKRRRREDRQAKQANFLDIEKQKQDAADNINLWKRRQNSKAVQNYRELMSRQDSIKSDIQTNICQLEERQKHLINRLEHSFIQRDKLNSALKNAYTIELDTLENLINEKPKSQARTARVGTSNQRVRNSNMSDRIKAGATVDLGSPKYKHLNMTINTFPIRKDANPEDQLPVVKKKRGKKSKKSKALQ